MYGRQITTSVQLQTGNPEIQLTALYVGENSAAMADIVGVPTGASDVKVVVVKPGSAIPWEYNTRKVGNVWRVTFTNETFDTLGESFYEVHFKMPTYYFSGRGKLTVTESTMQGIVPQMDPSDPEAGRYVVLSVNGKKPDGTGNVVIDISAEVADKADKVKNATAGNLASLTADGNIADSGKNPASFAGAEDLAAETVTRAAADMAETAARKAADDKLYEGVYGNGYSLIKKVREYLWLTEYRAIDYEGVEEWLKQNYQFAAMGLCSVARNFRYFGRNYDWYYDESASFIVRTEAHNGKHRTMGIAGGIKQLTDEIVASRAKNDWMKAMPCMITDGINDVSLTACVNVVPKKATSGWHGRDVCVFSGVRYALDGFSTAQGAARFLADAVWVPVSWNFDVHFILADRTSTWLVEDGVAKDITSRPWVTNYRVATDATGSGRVDYSIVNGLDPYGIGLERMNIILENYATANTEAGMRSLLQKLKYTKAYAPEEEPYWHTEFCGNDSFGNLTVVKAVTEPDAFANKESHWQAVFNERSRKRGTPGFGTWQTVSSVVYDVFLQKMKIIVQEEDASFSVEVNLDGTATTTMDGLMSAADKEKLDNGGAGEGKADKVKNATAGHLASLTVDGNLADSGVSATEIGAAIARIGSRVGAYANGQKLILTTGDVPS